MPRIRLLKPSEYVRDTRRPTVVAVTRAPTTARVAAASVPAPRRKRGIKILGTVAQRAS